MAVDKVRYMAEAVAAVAAVDEDIAEEAADLIEVEYEELPGVFDPEEAMQDGAPKVHDYVKNNISVEYHWNFGDVEKAFAESYIVREDRFRTAKSTHGYIEPPATLDCSTHCCPWARATSTSSSSTWIYWTSAARTIWPGPCASAPFANRSP